MWKDSRNTPPPEDGTPFVALESDVSGSAIVYFTTFVEDDGDGGWFQIEDLSDVYLERDTVEAGVWWCNLPPELEEKARHWIEVEAEKARHG